MGILPHANRVFWLLLLTLIATACGLAPDFSSESPLLATLERKSGRIAYIGIDRNVYTINQGGGDQIAVTDDASIPTQEDSDGPIRFYQPPIWSPDSSMISFTALSGDTSSTPDTAHIYTAPTDGGFITEIFRSNTLLPTYLSWSPDSGQVSYLAQNPLNVNMQLGLVGARGGNEARVIDAGQPLFWTWSPAGNRLLVHIGGSTSQDRISFLYPEENVHEQWLAFEPSIFQAPAWSPNGEQIVVAAANEAGDSALLLLDNAGEVVEELALVGETAVSFAWSSDNEKIAYIETQGGRQGNIGPITIVDVNQTSNRITSEEDQVIAFFWSPDNQKIAYFVPRILNRGSEDGSGSEGEDANQVFLLQLHVWDLNSDTTTELMVFQPTDEFLTMIQFYDQYHRSATLWSPNSQYLVITGVAGEGGAPQVWVVNIDDNLAPRPITPGIMAYWSWE